MLKGTSLLRLGLGTVVLAWGGGASGAARSIINDSGKMSFSVARYVGSYERQEIKGRGWIQVLPSTDDFYHINAVGRIEEGTAAAFVAFLKANSVKQAVIHFASPGGDLGGALALGREIRQRRFATTVSYRKDYEDPVATEADFVPTRCESACVYAFLGGVVRTLEASADFLLSKGAAPHRQSRLGLHQFKANLGVEARAAGSAVASELGVSAAQYTAEALASYLQEMGASPTVLTLANRAPIDPVAVQGIYHPSIEELVTAGVLTSNRLGPAILATAGGGLGIVSRSATWDMNYRQVSLYCSHHVPGPALRLVVSTVGFLSPSERGPFEAPFHQIEAQLRQPESDSERFVKDLFPWELRLSVGGQVLAIGGTSGNGRRASQKIRGASLSHQAVTIPLSAGARLAEAASLNIELRERMGTQPDEIKDLTVPLDTNAREAVSLLSNNCLRS